MKKLLAILLSGVLALSLVSCGDKKDPAETQAGETTEEIITAPEENDVPVAADFAWELVDVAVDFTTNAASPKILVVSGHGRMPDFSEDENEYLNRPWESEADNIVHVYVRDGLTSVSDHAFMFFRNMKSVTFENAQFTEGKKAACDVTTLGNCAFYGCYNLGVIRVTGQQKATGEDGKSIPKPVTVEDVPASAQINGEVELPSGIKNIGDYSFRACIGMKKITLPDTLSYVGSNAFRGCTGLETAVIKSGLKSISEGMFYDCTALKSVSGGNSAEGIVLPESVTKIGGSAFFGCSSAAEVKLPAGVTSIGDYAFCKMTSLTKISLPSKVKTVGKGAFFGCGSLTEVYLPASVTSLGNNIVRDCDALGSIRFAGKKDKWNGIKKAESGLATVTVKCSDGDVAWNAVPEETESESQAAEG